MTVATKEFVLELADNNKALGDATE